MIMFDSEAFFNSIRDSLFDGHLVQSQVTGINYVLREWRRRYKLGGDHRHLANMLAQEYWETGRTMLPIIEYGGEEYLQTKDYYPYYGRGLIMITWLDNYSRAGDSVDEDLVNYPDRACIPNIAAEIMFDGMRDGWFTGLKLSDFFNDDTDDPYNARRIVNGLDRAEEIAGYHQSFLDALEAAMVRG